MVSDIAYIVGAVGTFFAILDPFGNLPFFIAYTSNLVENQEIAEL